MNRTELESLKAKIRLGKKIKKLGYTEKTEQSDKLGFDWKITLINSVEVVKEYVAQDNPKGTAENPIVYTDGTPLILNAFYLKDGKMYVWMGEWVEW